MLGGQSSPIPSYDFPTCLPDGFACKKKRRPAGTPDPDAEVVALSPRTLMEKNNYICEICSQGFPREQNLQMHRRRHNVPWKLVKREAVDTVDAPKRVYVCPDPTCVHHDPSHALGDLVGVKKHFRRKHTNQRQWVCEKCSKGYAVPSDLKAHLKTCGTKGHSCDCGRVFSRAETFIEHQETCKAPKPAYPTSSINTNFTLTHPSNSTMPIQQKLQNLLTSPSNSVPLCTELKLSVGCASQVENNELNISSMNNETSKAHLIEMIGTSTEDALVGLVQRLRDEARQQLEMAAEEKAFAGKKRQQANWEIEMAKQEMMNANRIREQALTELSMAEVMKERAVKRINANTLQITCNACKKWYFQVVKEGNYGQCSPFVGYVSSVAR